MQAPIVRVRYAQPHPTSCNFLERGEGERSLKAVISGVLSDLDQAFSTFDQLKNLAKARGN
jgi:hypothetical protein